MNHQIPFDIHYGWSFFKDAVEGQPKTAKGSTKSS